MPFALAIETAVVVAGLYLFVCGTHVGRKRPIALVMLSLLVTIFTGLGMTIAPAPPSATAMAAGSLGALVVVCALACWFGKRKLMPSLQSPGKDQ